MIRRAALWVAIVAGVVGGISLWRSMEDAGSSPREPEALAGVEATKTQEPPEVREEPILLEPAELPPAPVDEAPPPIDVRQPAVEPTPSPPKGLVVRVVDLIDRPVTDFPVLLQANGSRKPRSEDEGYARSSDAQGQVVFTADELASLSRALGEERAWVALDRRIPDPPGIEVELLNPPASPVVLRAAVGLATVEIRDWTGSPSVDRGVLDIDSVRSPRFSMRCTSPAEVWIPLDSAYSLRARRFGPGFDAELDCPAMTPEDPNAHHILEIPGRYPALVGRLLLPDGSPAPMGTRFEMNCIEIRYYGANTWFTDEGGRFRIPVIRAGIPRGREVRLRFAASSGEIQEARCKDILAFVSSDPEDTEVGDVQLMERPILVAGRVIGPQGEPIHKVSLTLQYRQAGGLWEDFDYQAGRGMMTGVDGTFRYFADPTDPEGVWRVLVNERRSSLEREAVLDRLPFFSRGEEELVIQFLDPAWIEGTLIGGDPHPQSDSFVVFARSTPPGDPHAEPITAHAEADQSGRFRVGPLPPGDGIIEVRTRPTSAPIHELPPVSLVSGEVTEVGDIDLASATHHKIKVSVTNLEASERVTIWYGPQGSSLDYRARGRGTTPTQLSVASLPVQIFLSAEHRQPRVIEDALDDVELELQPMPKASIVCTGVREAALVPGWEEDVLLVRLVFEPVDGELVPLAPLGAVSPVHAEYWVQRDEAPANPHAKQSRVAEFPRPGRYRVRVLVSDLRKRRPWTSPYPDGTDLGEIDILPGSEQRHTFAIAPD